jgi:hypothetical protein
MVIIYTHEYLWTPNYGTACGFCQNIPSLKMFNYSNINDDKNYAGSDFILCLITNVMQKSEMKNTITLW